MRTDRRISTVHTLTVRQRFFCDCWFNLVHEASLDAFRVRAMNPLNIMRELLRMFDVEHAKEPDIGRVALEAHEVLEAAALLQDAAFQPAASQLVALLRDVADSKPVKSASEEGAKSTDAAKLAGTQLLKDRFLVDAFGRELIHALEQHFVQKSIAWLSAELTTPDANEAFDALEPQLQKIENVLSALLSTLVNQAGASPRCSSCTGICCCRPTRERRTGHIRFLKRCTMCSAG